MGTSVPSLVYLTLAIHKPGAVVEKRFTSYKTGIENKNANTTQNYAAKTRLEHDFTENMKCAFVCAGAGKSPTGMIFLLGDQHWKVLIGSVKSGLNSAKEKYETPEAVISLLRLFDLFGRI